MNKQKFLATLASLGIHAEQADNAYKEILSNSETLDEPILRPSNERLVSLPDKQYPRLWELYNKAWRSIWVPSDINPTLDQWNKLNNNEKHFISMVLAFFASSDGIVNENLATRFYNEVQIPEARFFYGIQIGIETVHAHTYSMILETYIKDKAERERLFHAIDTIPCIKRKADWAFEWIESNKSFAHRLIAFACVELIFFSGAFCSIFWLKQKDNLLKGLSMANDYISRDEGLHGQFACELYKLLKNKLSVDEVHAIIKDAVEIEKEFICKSLPVSLVGMNKALMSDYIEYCSDIMCEILGIKMIYKTKNPFPWMTLIAMQLKPDFFSENPTQYSKKEVAVQSTGQDNFESYDDF